MASDKDHALVVLQHLNTFRQEARLIDTCLLYEEKILICVHRIVLVTFSQYFKELLTKQKVVEGELSIEYEMLTLSVHESFVGFDVMKNLVDYMYTGVIDFLTADNKSIYHLAATKLIMPDFLSKLSYWEDQCRLTYPILEVSLDQQPPVFSELQDTTDDWESDNNPEGTYMMSTLSDLTRIEPGSEKKKVLKNKKSQNKTKIKHRKVIYGSKNIKEGEKTFDCYHCQSQFRTKRSRGEHIANVHAADIKDPFLCEVPGCTFRASRNKDVHNHFNRDHKDRYVIGSIILDKMRKSGNIDPNLKIYKCYHCKAEFTIKKVRNDHINQSHAHIIMRFHCEEDGCEYKSVDYYTMLIHLGLVHNQGKYANRKETQYPKKKGILECKECEYTTNLEKPFMLHQARHKGVQPYTCEECGKAFGRMSQLREHTNYHSEKKFKCPYCVSKFFSKKKCVEHIAKFHKDISNPFLCSVDGCSFSADTNFKVWMHERHTHREKSKYYKKSSTTQERWRNWKLNHQKRLKLTVYTCDQPGCDYETLGPALITTHKKTVHGMEYPHKCPVCHLRCKTYLLLERHIIFAHMAKTSNPCPHCEENFEMLSILIRHIEQNHKKDNAFECQMVGCETAVNTKEEFVDHLKTKHGCSGSHLLPNYTEAEITHLKRKRKSYEQDMPKPKEPTMNRSTDNGKSCLICDKLWTDLDEDIKTHIEKHFEKELPLMKCPYCEISCEEGYILTRHFQASHPDITNPYTCNFGGCTERFRLSSDLADHQRRSKHSSRLTKGSSIATDENRQAVTQKKQEVDKLIELAKKRHAEKRREAHEIISGSSWGEDSVLTDKDTEVVEVQKQISNDAQANTPPLPPSNNSVKGNGQETNFVDVPQSNMNRGKDTDGPEKDNQITEEGNITKSVSANVGETQENSGIQKTARKSTSGGLSSAINKVVQQAMVANNITKAKVIASYMPGTNLSPGKRQVPIVRVIKLDEKFIKSAMPSKQHLVKTFPESPLPRSSRRKSTSSAKYKDYVTEFNIQTKESILQNVDDEDGEIQAIEAVSDEQVYVSPNTEKLSDEYPKSGGGKYVKTRPFACDMCSYRTTLKEYLTVHRQCKHKLDLDVKPFQCHLCDEHFRESRSLKEHLRKHTGEMPFACPHCPLMFPIGRSMVFHIKGQHKDVEKPFLCSHQSCGFRANTNKEVFVHKKTEHRILSQKDLRKLKRVITASDTGTPKKKIHLETTGTGGPDDTETVTLDKS